MNNPTKTREWVRTTMIPTHTKLERLRTSRALHNQLLTSDSVKSRTVCWIFQEILLANSIPRLERIASRCSCSHSRENLTILVNPLPRLGDILLEASVLDIQEHHDIEREVTDCSNRDVPERNVTLLERNRACIRLHQVCTRVAPVSICQLNDQTTNAVMGQDDVGASTELLVHDI